MKTLLSGLRLEMHPAKTFIGRVARGFDFLGYHFFDGMLSAATTTLAKMTETAARLYERERRGDGPTPLVELPQALERLAPGWTWRVRPPPAYASDASP